MLFHLNKQNLWKISSLDLNMFPTKIILNVPILIIFRFSTFINVLLCTQKHVAHLFLFYLCFFSQTTFHFRHLITTFATAVSECNVHDTSLHFYPTGHFGECGHMATTQSRPSQIVYMVTIVYVTTTQTTL